MLRAVHGHQHTKFGKDTWFSCWVMAIFFFSKWRPAAISDFVPVKNDITARCGLSMFTTVPNLVIISKMAAELLWISVFQNGGQPPSWIFVAQKWRHGTLRAIHGYPHTKFGEDISKSGWVMVIFLFTKWRPAAILDLARPTYRSTHDVALAVLSVLANFVLIWLILSKI